MRCTIGKKLNNDDIHASAGHDVVNHHDNCNNVIKLQNSGDIYYDNYVDVKFGDDNYINFIITRTLSSQSPSTSQDNHHHHHHHCCTRKR